MLGYCKFRQPNKKICGGGASITSLFHVIQLQKLQLSQLKMFFFNFRFETPNNLLVLFRIVE